MFSPILRLLSLAVVAAFPAVAGPLAAQSVAAGRVARVAGRDTVPLGGLNVVLHRVGTDRQGPMDTVRSDARGRFRFRFATDTTASWLLSARWAGIEYFSSPVTANPDHADTAIVLLVSDTSSQVPVTVRHRTLLVSRPDEGGTRVVLDWFVLLNGSTETRVAADTAAAVWGFPLPERAQDVELADSRMSQFASEAISFRGDSVIIHAPISPGQKELMLQYRLPGTGRRIAVPVSAMDSLFVLLEAGGGRVVSPPMVAADTQVIEGRNFRRWSAHLAAAGTLTLDLSGPALSTGQALALLVTAAALAFLALAATLLRRRAVRAGPPAPAALVERLAQLDARYLDARDRTPPEEWARYELERASLKESLAAALAATRARR